MTLSAISAGALGGAAALGGTAGGVLIGGLAATGIGIVIGAAILSVLAITGFIWTKVGQADEVKELLIDKLSSA
jgi:hypothetical protein